MNSVQCIVGIVTNDIDNCQIILRTYTIYIRYHALNDVNVCEAIYGEAETNSLEFSISLQILRVNKCSLLFIY